MFGSSAINQCLQVDYSVLFADKACDAAVESLAVQQVGYETGRADVSNLGLSAKVSCNIQR